MELNREQVVKAFECCTLGGCNCLGDCPYRGTSGDWVGEECWRKARNDAYTLFKELTEENEYLKQQNEIYAVLNKKLEDACESYAWTYGTSISKELFLEKERTDTVHKMQTMFEERLDISTCGYSTEEVVSDVLETLDQIAKELLEENK